MGTGFTRRAGIAMGAGRDLDPGGSAQQDFIDQFVGGQDIEKRALRFDATSLGQPAVREIAIQKHNGPAGMSGGHGQIDRHGGATHVALTTQHGHQPRLRSAQLRFFASAPRYQVA